MNTNKKISERRMDWHLFWTALGVVIPVVSCVIGYGMSVNRNIRSIEKSINERISAIDKRLVVIETVIIMSGHDIKGIVLNKNERIDEKLEKK